MEPAEREMFLLFLDGANIEHQLQGLLLVVAAEDEQRIRDLLETITTDTLVDFDPSQVAEIPDSSDGPDSSDRRDGRPVGPIDEHPEESSEALRWSREMASQMHPASTPGDPPQLAVVMQRIIAAIVSYFMWWVVIVLLFAALTFSPEDPPYMAVLAISLLPLLGDTWLTAWNGTTPGKYVVGIRVVNLHGYPPGWRSSIVRTLVVMWPVLLAYWPGGVGQIGVAITPAWMILLVVTILRDPDSQGLHDRLAGTRVVVGRHPDHSAS
ncbi:MAG: RDD family protein [Microthrixaceae bacterium]